VPEAFLEDEEQLLREGELLDDDIIRGDMPAAAAIPWLSSIQDAFLEIEELGCLEINNDAIGPPLAEMLPYFRMVQTVRRSLLIRGSLAPDDARLLMDSLDPRGLYLLVVVKDRREAETLKPLLKM